MTPHCSHCNNDPCTCLPTTFPIQGQPAKQPRGITIPACTIPWAMIASHSKQAYYNHSGQSLKRIAERGGLSYAEAIAVLEDRPWEPMSCGDAVMKLADMVDRWKRGSGEAPETIEQEVIRLRRMVYMPSTWKCDVCGFELNQFVMNPNTGQVGTPIVSEVPTCPNRDRSVMRQVTWEECAGGNQEAAHRFLDERDEARERYNAARSLALDPEEFDKRVDAAIAQSKEKQKERETFLAISMPPGPPEAA